MGLAVAYELTRLGHQPVLLEADNRLGGMAACFDFAGMQHKAPSHARRLRLFVRASREMWYYG